MISAGDVARVALAAQSIIRQVVQRVLEGPDTVDQARGFRLFGYVDPAIRDLLGPGRREPATAGDGLNEAIVDPIDDTLELCRLIVGDAASEGAGGYLSRTR